MNKLVSSSAFMQGYLKLNNYEIDRFESSIYKKINCTYIVMITKFKNSKYTNKILTRIYTFDTTY